MFKIGQRVRFIDVDAHEWSPNLYPPFGSVGIVMRIDVSVNLPLVKWTATDGDYYLWTMSDMLEAVDES